MEAIEKTDDARPYPVHSGYTVYRDGRIRGPWGKILRPFPDSRGYLRINIWSNGRWKQVSVHRVVCETFHGPKPSPKHGAGHGDGNNRNNHADNLRWVTQKENEDDKAKHGRNMIGERHHKAKLSELDVLAIRESRDSCYVAGRKYGVTPSTINNIRLRKTWRHI